MTDDLEEIAKRGRDLSRKADAAQDDEALKKQRKEAREREQNLWQSFTQWSLLTGDLWWLMAFWIVFVPSFVALILILVKLNVSDTVGMILVPGHGRLFFPWPVFALVYGVVKLAPRMCRRTIERERAWLASLPFTVSGFLDCLGDRYRVNESEVRLDLEFVGDQPGHALLLDILKADGGSWKLKGHRAVRDPGPESRWREDDNRKVVRWFHSLLLKQLLPLHAKYPLRSVTLSNGNSH